MADFLQRAYALTDAASAEMLYNAWADNYDNDLNTLKYRSPQAAVDAMIEHVDEQNMSANAKLQVLDAGCGTGMDALCLNRSRLAGHVLVDGLDLSTGMLDVAQKHGIYRKLEVADLSKRINCNDSCYDIALCVGTLTKGHVGPQLIKELVRVTKPAGLVIATVHDEIWQSGGYMAEVHRLEGAGLVKVLRASDFGITEGSNHGGKMVVLKSS